MTESEEELRRPPPVKVPAIIRALDERRDRGPQPFTTRPLGRRAEKAKRRAGVAASRALYTRPPPAGQYPARIITVAVCSAVSWVLAAWMACSILIIYSIAESIFFSSPASSQNAGAVMMMSLFLTILAAGVGAALSPIAMAITIRCAQWPTIVRSSVLASIGAGLWLFVDWALGLPRVGLVPLLNFACLGWIAGLFWARATTPRIWPTLPRHGLCAACGYDRAGLGTRPCPECGRPAPAPRACRCCGEPLPIPDQSAKEWDRLPIHCAACRTPYEWRLLCQCCGHPLTVTTTTCPGCAQATGL